MTDEILEQEPLTVEGPVQQFVPNPMAPIDPSLAVALAKAEVDQQIATARAFPRSIGDAISNMVTFATMNADMAEECIYSLPRGGKQVRGPSIRFAEVARNCWGNSRDAARVVHVDRLERFVECEAVYHDLQTNIATTSRVRRTIELKKGKQTVDLDMIQLAGAAGMSIARRNAILGGIPKVAWEPARIAVEQVIRGTVQTLVERRDRALGWFNKSGVTTERVLKGLAAARIEDIDLDHLVVMQGWKTAINSGESNFDEIFPEDKPPAQRKTLTEQLDALAAKPETPAADASSNAKVEAPAAAKVDPSAAAGAPAAKPALAPQGAIAGQPAAAAAKPGADSAPAAPKASAAPKAAKPENGRAAYLAALQRRGEAVAEGGIAALEDWLRNLSPDDSAAVTVAMQKAWRAAAAQFEG